LEEGRILGSLKVSNLIVNNFGQLPFDAGSSSQTMLVTICLGQLKTTSNTSASTNSQVSSYAHTILTLTTIREMPEHLYQQKCFKTSHSH